MQSVSVAIIGAGTAGLTAAREVSRLTKDFVLIDGGPLGTTCARVGCMPSKVLVQVAEDYHRRAFLETEGIRGSLSVDGPAALAHVRRLRDDFVNSVVKSIEELPLIRGMARFKDTNTLEVAGHGDVKADKVILAAGSSPAFPGPWESLKGKVLTSDTVFDLKSLPASLAVVGLGPVGLELGQAFARLGVEVHGFHQKGCIGGLSDPEVNRHAHRLLEGQLSLHCGEPATAEPGKGGWIVRAGDVKVEVEQVLLATGRTPNTENLGLENLGVPLQENGLPLFDTSTLEVPGAHLFIAGDANADRPILHEAADEGRIAGYNCVRSSPHRFRRRTPLAITFCHPNLVAAGTRFRDLDENAVAGEVSFENQGRSRVKGKNAGVLRVYGSPSGAVLGAEMAAPEGEHLGHLLAWAIDRRLTASEMLQLPYYHPTVEEGLRTAVRSLARQTDVSLDQPELALCEETGVTCLE